MKKKNITWWKWGDIDGDVHLNDFPKLRTYLEEEWQVKLNDDLLLPANEELIEKSTFLLNDFKKMFSELDENIFSNTDINRLKYGYNDLSQFHLMTTFFGTPYVGVRIDFNSWLPKKLGKKIKGLKINDSQSLAVLREPITKSRIISPISVNAIEPSAIVLINSPSTTSTIP